MAASAFHIRHLRGWPFFLSRPFLKGPEPVAVSSQCALQPRAVTGIPSVSSLRSLGGWSDAPERSIKLTRRVGRSPGALPRRRPGLSRFIPKISLPASVIRCPLGPPINGHSAPVFLRHCIKGPPPPLRCFFHPQTDFLFLVSRPITFRRWCT